MSIDNILNINRNKININYYIYIFCLFVCFTLRNPIKLFTIPISYFKIKKFNNAFYY